MTRGVLDSPGSIHPARSKEAKAVATSVADRSAISEAENTRMMAKYVCAYSCAVRYAYIRRRRPASSRGSGSAASELSTKRTVVTSQGDSERLDEGCFAAECPVRRRSWGEPPFLRK